MAAEGLITFEELRTKLAELEETRELAERELETLRGRQDRVEEMERDRNAHLMSYAEVLPEALAGLTPQERHRVYRMIGLRVFADADETLSVIGLLREPSAFRCDMELTSVAHP